MKEEKENMKKKVADKDEYRGRWMWEVKGQEKKEVGKLQLEKGEQLEEEYGWKKEGRMKRI